MKSALRSVGYTLVALAVAACTATPVAHASYQPNATAAAAPPVHKLALQYGIYAGGFRALDASLTMGVGQKAYDMELAASTQGFIGTLFPWKGSYNTEGEARNGALIPATYTARSTWRNNLKLTRMNYAPDGTVVKMTVEDGGKTTDDKVDNSLARDSMDMLTGTLAALQNVKNTNKCSGKFPVFDGKRRFNIALKDDGREVLEASQYSAFSGEALRCTLTVEPVAGFKPKDQKRGWMAVQNHTEAHHKLPTLWLARVKGSNQVVPVRMEIASDYGSVVAHLTSETAR